MKSLVEDYLNNKNEDIPVQNKIEAKKYFKIMKGIYHSRMSEYITELSKI